MDGGGIKRNWWKAAFLVSLVLLEFTREWAVLADEKAPSPVATPFVIHAGDFTSVSGRWIRIDGGGDLVPSLVTIECDRDEDRCLEASTMILDDSVFAPELSWYPAQFGSDAITYENADPRCATYSVRIDLELEKVFAVRTRKEDPELENCGRLERRIEMQLSDGYQPSNDPLEGHFVPIFSVLFALFD